MKRRKVWLQVLLAALLITLVPVSADAEVLGYVYDSNTNAFIDGYLIPVYTYQNYPYIVAEDLNGYGFDCSWDAATDILSIQYNYDKGLYPYDTVELMPAQGRVLETVYASETKVKLGDRFINAYSLGGRMLISLDDLYTYGAVNWYPDTQSVAFTSRRFMDINPDWQTLMPASYILDVLNSYNDTTFSFLWECAHDVAGTRSYFEEYGYDYYNDYAYTPFYVSSEVRNQLNRLNAQLLSMADSIQSNRMLYYKSDAYHMVYAAAMQAQNAMTLYDIVNGHTYDAIVSSGRYDAILEAITNQDNDYVTKYNTYADKVWAYLYY